MSSIHVLPQNLANQIAAGEVVERPASVIKELVENSLDAGARKIVVEIRRGGVTFMRVTDDGYGMRPEDAKLAFLRHATSKISSSEDLNAIMTYGFRGEALAAISSVSRIELITCVDSARTGFFMTLEGGEIKEEDEIGAPVGTSIIVRDLFYNTPARLSFLKKDSTEAAAVISVMQQMAIGRYDVSFTLISEGKVVFQSAASDRMKNAIHAVYGADVVNNLLPIRFSYGGYTLSGYAGRPILTRATRNMQLVFLNSRAIKSKLVYRGIDNAYRSVRETGKHPVCFIDIKIAPDQVDVNVHPAKLEVKFLEESKLMLALKYGLMDALESETPIYVSTSDGFRPAAEVLNVPGGVMDPEENDVSLIAHQVLFPSQHKKDPPPNPGLFDAGFVAEKQAAQFYSTAADQAGQTVKSDNFSDVNHRDSAPFMPQPKPPVLPAGMRIIGEIFTIYYIVEYKERVYLIDKHAAHEKLIYNRLVRESENSTNVSAQRLLVPLELSLSASDMDLVLLNVKTFNTAGFDFHELDQNKIAITTAPTLLDHESYQDAFMEILKMIHAKKTEALTERQNKIFKMLACRSAIKGGKSTKPEEIIPILTELVEQTDVNYCPHGRPIVISKSKSEIDRLFKRLK